MVKLFWGFILLHLNFVGKRKIVIGYLNFRSPPLPLYNLKFKRKLQLQRKINSKSTKKNTSIKKNILTIVISYKHWYYNCPKEIIVAMKKGQKNTWFTLLSVICELLIYFYFNLLLILFNQCSFYFSFEFAKKKKRFFMWLHLSA